MSDVLRIALVAEGYTDKIVIDAAIESLVGEDRSYVLTLLQPEESLPLEPASTFTGVGKGWGGVYLWCREARQRSGGSIQEDPLFLQYDMLILHLDADVASRRYSDCSLRDTPDDLPCDEPCPPPSATTDRLRKVMLGWVGQENIPPKMVLCTPSKSTEAWVAAALFPDDKEMRRKGWECHPSPGTRFGNQPKESRIIQSEAGYKGVKSAIVEVWPRLRRELSEAGRFSSDFLKNLSH